MSLERLALCRPLVFALPGVASARPRSERERLRAAAISDEGQLQSCRTAERSQRSPACHKIFDRGRT